MKNELFVTAGEVAQELGVSKPFAYKLVRQRNWKKKVLSQSPDVSAENIMKKNSTAWRRLRTREGRLWHHIKMNSVGRGMYRSIITTGWARTAEKSREVSKPKEKLRSGNTISA